MQRQGQRPVQSVIGVKLTFEVNNLGLKHGQANLKARNQSGVRTGDRCLRRRRRSTRVPKRGEHTARSTSERQRDTKDILRRVVHEPNDSDPRPMLSMVER